MNHSIELFIEDLKVKIDNIKPLSTRVLLIGAKGAGKSILSNHLLTCISSEPSVLDHANTCSEGGLCNRFPMEYSSEVLNLHILDTAALDITWDQNYFLELLVGAVDVKDISTVGSKDRLDAFFKLPPIEQMHKEINCVVFIISHAAIDSFPNQLMREYIELSRSAGKYSIHFNDKYIYWALLGYSPLVVATHWQGVAPNEQDDVIQAISQKLNVNVKDIVPFGLYGEAINSNLRDPSTDIQSLGILHRIQDKVSIRVESRFGI